MKLVTWNVNGIRSVFEKGFLSWFEKTGADVVCLQETKAHREQLHEGFWHPLGHTSLWHSAEKKGYSGTLIYSKKEPISVAYGLGTKEFDCEGRVVTAEFPNFTLVNAYFPNSQREHTRLPYKLKFCKKMLVHLEGIRQQGKHVLLCGDFNIAHKEIDLKNPKENVHNAGFLPQERAWFEDLVKHGYVDAFRKFNKDPGHYTWWSYRPTIRERNIGWRLDYFVSNPEFQDRLTRIEHQTSVMGSDHCPVLLELKR